MLKLSKATEERIRWLFTEADWTQAARILEEECGNNLPFCEKRDEIQMERTRFAVLKLSEGNLDKLKTWVKEAQIDSRDVLMIAGFGEDITAHKQWKI